MPPSDSNDEDYGIPSSDGNSDSSSDNGAYVHSVTQSVGVQYLSKETVRKAYAETEGNPFAGPRDQGLPAVYPCGVHFVRATPYWDENWHLRVVPPPLTAQQGYQDGPLNPILIANVYSQGSGSYLLDPERLLQFGHPFPCANNFGRGVNRAPGVWASSPEGRKRIPWIDPLRILLFKDQQRNHSWCFILRFNTFILPDNYALTTSAALQERRAFLPHLGLERFALCQNFSFKVAEALRGLQAKILGSLPHQRGNHPYPYSFPTPLEKQIALWDVWAKTF